MDGCSRLGTLFRVTIPAASAGIAATAILLLISTWNEFLFAVILGDTGAVTVTRRIGFIDSPTSVSAQPPYTLQAAAGSWPSCPACPARPVPPSDRGGPNGGVYQGMKWLGRDRPASFRARGWIGGRNDDSTEPRTQRRSPDLATHAPAQHSSRRASRARRRQRSAAALRTVGQRIAGSATAPRPEPRLAHPPRATAGASPSLRRPPRRTSRGHVNVACNPTNVAHATAAGPLWEAKTGGKVVATLVPYAERALKFAADIVNQNPNFDLYFASKDFVAQFGDRLYVPMDKLGLDTSDYVPITLKQLANNGKTVALPLFADQELFIYNQDYWTEAGLDPSRRPTTWDEMYALTPKLTALKAASSRPMPRRSCCRRRRTGCATTTASTSRSSATTNAGPVRQRPGRRGVGLHQQGPDVRLLRTGRAQRGVGPGWRPDLQPGPCRLGDRHRQRSGPGPERERQGLQGDHPQDGRRARGDARCRCRDHGSIIVTEGWAWAPSARTSQPPRAS